MRGSILRPFLAVLGAVLVLAGCSDATGDQPTTTTTEGVPPAIDDGTWFAFVTVGEDETGEMNLGLDLAEFLSGEEARQAAVEDGVIADGEDLPNDFYIDNDEIIMELLHVGEGAVFEMISGDDTAQTVEVDASQFAELYDGTYAGEPVYGVVAHTPIAMNVVVVDNLVTGATAVYLP